MKKLLSLFTLLACFALVGCATNLEKGGAYNQVAQAPDQAFYAIDATFDLTVGTFTYLSDLERNNRLMFWNLSHDIKLTLDRLRPQAKVIALQYAIGRKAYLKFPTAEGITTLQTTLGRMQQLSTAAQAVVPTIN